MSDLPLVDSSTGLGRTKIGSRFVIQRTNLSYTHVHELGRTNLISQKVNYVNH